MRRLLCTLHIGLVLLVGCGQGTYDERLEKRISELKSAPAATENDGAEGGEEETTEEDEAASAEDDTGQEK